MHDDVGEEKSLLLGLDIGGGLVLDRKITMPKNNPTVFQIDSSIRALKVGAGSGGFSRYAPFSFLFFLNLCNVYW